MAIGFAILSELCFIALEGEPPERPPIQLPEVKLAVGPDLDGDDAYAGRRIDVHTHIHPGAYSVVQRLMDQFGIQTMVNLIEVPPGDAYAAMVEHTEKAGNGRFIPFCGLDWQHLRHADFGARMAADLELGHSQGCRGLKIPKALGLFVPAPEGGLLEVDDARLAPVFEVAAKHGMPVAIHVADPVAFWDPLDEKNERWDELKLHPNWSYAGKDVPSHAELMAAQKRLFLRHPQTTFIAVHVAGNSEDLDWVGALLDDADNVVVDISARVPELGHHATAVARAFFVDHQDRILFGTDFGLNAGGVMLGAPLAWKETKTDVDHFFASTWRYLETDDRDFAHPTPIQGNWTISGLKLPPEVLEKVYWKNAERVLGLTPPAR